MQEGTGYPSNRGAKSAIAFGLMHWLKQCTMNVLLSLSGDFWATYLSKMPYGIYSGEKVNLYSSSLGGEILMQSRKKCALDHILEWLQRHCYAENVACS